VLSYGLDDRGHDSLLELGIFLLTMAFRPALRPTKLPIKWVAWALSLGVKQPGSESNHSPESSAEVRMRGDILSLPQHAFMAWCLVKAQGQLYLYLIRDESHLIGKMKAILSILQVYLYIES